MARKETFQAWWCEPGGADIQQVDTVESGAGQLDWNTNADLKISGSLRVHDVPRWVNPLVHRVRVQATINGKVARLGTYCLEQESVARGKSKTSTALRLLDQLLIPQDDLIVGPYAVKAGANAVDEAVKVIKETGETRFAITKSDSKLATPLVWEPGTSRQKVANDLLAAAGYWSVRTNVNGDFVFRPYVLPEDRPIAHNFVAGQASLMLPDYERETNHAGIPNRFIAVSPQYDEGSKKTQDGKETAKWEGLVGVADLTNPDSPFSIPSRGRVVAVSEQVEASTQKEINNIAKAKLSALVQPTAKISATHALIPGLWLDDLVFVRPSHGSVFMATVTQMSIPLRAGGLVKAQWREVFSLG